MSDLNSPDSDKKPISQSPKPPNQHNHHDHAAHTPDAGAETTESFASNIKGKAGFGRIFTAAGYSADGFAAAYKNEAAFRQAFWLNLVLLIALVFVPLTIPMKMILLIASVLSIIVELFNTGLEASIDHTSTKQHPLAKIGKDVGSAAQFLALSMLFILWVMALWTLR
mgnify:CR=1 FL=1